MKVKWEESVIWLFWKINNNNHINEKVSSRAVAPIDVVVRRGMFKITKITLFPCFSPKPKTGGRHLLCEY